MDEAHIVVYGTTWCERARWALCVLDSYAVRYRSVDIDLDVEGRRFVEQINRGFRSVPTTLLPEGDILVEPSDDRLRSRLGQ